MVAGGVEVRGCEKEEGLCGGARAIDRRDVDEDACVAFEFARERVELADFDMRGRG